MAGERRRARSIRGGGAEHAEEGFLWRGERPLSELLAGVERGAGVVECLRAGHPGVQDEGADADVEAGENEGLPVSLQDESAGAIQWPDSADPFRERFPSHWRAADEAGSGVRTRGREGERVGGIPKPFVLHYRLCVSSVGRVVDSLFPLVFPVFILTEHLFLLIIGISRGLRVL